MDDLQSCNVYSILQEVLKIRNIILTHSSGHLFRRCAWGVWVFFLIPIANLFACLLCTSWSVQCGFDPFANPWRIMQAVIYRIIICWKNVSNGPLLTQELTLENYQLVLLQDSSRPMFYYHLFKFRTLHSVFKKMLASKWPASLICIFYTYEELS